MPADFHGFHHRWVVDRPESRFVIRVIEPSAVIPAAHGEILTSSLDYLYGRMPAHVDLLGLGSTGNRPVQLPEPFDLAVFPEAFATQASLEQAIARMRAFGSRGCVHVGLRRDGDGHLFSTEEAAELAHQISALEGVAAEDLAPFKAWLQPQLDEAPKRFNLGCLLATDHAGRVRVCVHAKLVRSKFEGHPDPERDMNEADYLTVVTLQPQDCRQLSVTIQPAICSDALNLSTDRSTGSPIAVLNEHANCLGDFPPDHVDIVSVATCSPQTPIGTAPGREWHEQFLDTFKQAAQDGSRSRHHYAVFVLANYLETHTGAAAGLSGTFVPLPLGSGREAPHVTLSAFGRFKKDENQRNRWSTDAQARDADWSSRGFIAALNPNDATSGAPVRILGFIVQRLPRDTSRWESVDVLRRCRVFVGRRGDDGRFTFAPAEPAE